MIKHRLHPLEIVNLYMMLKPCHFLLIFLIVIVSPFPSVAQKEIQQQEVDRIVKTLSSDEMQGRKVFTAAIDKAGDFIKNEFRKIGLTPLQGLENYEQKFSVYSTSLRDGSLKINGRSIPQNEFWVQTHALNVRWTNPDDIKIHTIQEGEDFRQRYSAIIQRNEDALILIAEVHRPMFSRYQMYFSGPKVSFEKGKGKTRLFVLLDPVEVKTISAAINYVQEEKSLTNIVGTIPGKSLSREYVLFSAHYDHLGILAPVDGDSIANGADDNASGTTAVITLAKYFKSQPAPERTLVFVAFTAEEIGGYGSQYFSQQMDPESIVAMINIEMIGTPSKFGPNTAFMTGFERSDLGKILQENLRQTRYSLHPDPYPEQNLFYRSDNATLARHGVPAHTISSSQIDKDPFYHTVNDEYENIYIEHLTNMIRAIAVGVKSINEGKSTPTRIDPETVE